MLGTTEFLIRCIHHSSVNHVQDLVAMLSQIQFRGDERWTDYMFFDVHILDIDDPERKPNETRPEYQTRIAEAAKNASDTLRVVLDKVCLSFCETLKQFGFTYASKQGDVEQSVPLIKLKSIPDVALNSLWVRVKEEIFERKPQIHHEYFYKAEAELTRIFRLINVQLRI